MGSPARRLINPVTRCWDQPHYRYAGTDDGRGTDQHLTKTSYADERKRLVRPNAWPVKKVGRAASLSVVLFRLLVWCLGCRCFIG
jgi:hypothetical protein